MDDYILLDSPAALGLFRMKHYSIMYNKAFELTQSPEKARWLVEHVLDNVTQRFADQPVSMDCDMYLVAQVYLLYAQTGKRNAPGNSEPKPVAGENARSGGTRPEASVPPSPTAYGVSRNIPSEPKPQNVRPLPERGYAQSASSSASRHPNASQGYPPTAPSAFGYPNAPQGYPPTAPSAFEYPNAPQGYPPTAPSAYRQPSAADQEHPQSLPTADRSSQGAVNQNYPPYGYPGVPTHSPYQAPAAYGYPSASTQGYADSSAPLNHNNQSVPGSAPSRSPVPPAQSFMEAHQDYRHLSMPTADGSQNVLEQDKHPSSPAAASLGQSAADANPLFTQTAPQFDLPSHMPEAPSQNTYPAPADSAARDQSAAIDRRLPPQAAPISASPNASALPDRDQSGLRVAPITDYRNIPSGQNVSPGQATPAQAAAADAALEKLPASVAAAAAQPSPDKEGSAEKPVYDQSQTEFWTPDLSSGPSGANTPKSSPVSVHFDAEEEDKPRTSFSILNTLLVLLCLGALAFLILSIFPDILE